jgi:SHAQKYF class myb-like DNA-binding protein
MEGVVGNAAWSSEEHDRFLEALEKYGNGNTGDEWALMAKHVGTRAPNEIKLHAHKYFLRLQLAPGAASTGDAGVSGSRAVSCLDPAFDESDADWTQREDSRFEDALAQFGEGPSVARACYADTDTFVLLAPDASHTAQFPARPPVVFCALLLAQGSNAAGSE